MAKPIPDGYRTVTAALTVKNGARMIDFYKQAFGAQERMRMHGPDGITIMHAEIQVGDSLVMLGEEMPDMGCFAPVTKGVVTGSLYLYVPDVDAAFQRAVSAGAKAVMPPADMFWGDRFGTVEDPSGHRWGLATHTQDLTPEQIAEGQKKFMASMAKKG